MIIILCDLLLLFWTLLVFLKITTLWNLASLMKFRVVSYVVRHNSCFNFFYGSLLETLDSYSNDVFYMSGSSWSSGLVWLGNRFYAGHRLQFHVNGLTRNVSWESWLPPRNPERGNKNRFVLCILYWTRNTQTGNFIFCIRKYAI